MAACDPDFADVIALAQMVSGSLVEQAGNTLTVIGAGAPSSAQSLYGGFSFFNPGTATERANYLEISSASTTKLVFGTGDFTWRGYFRQNSYPEQFTSLFFSQQSYNTTGWWGLFLENNGALYFGCDGSTFLTTSAGAFPAGAWNFVEVTRVSGTVYIFVNGVLQTSGARGANIGLPAGPGSIILIGAAGQASSSDNSDFNGYISNVEVYKGIGLNTTNYTPPTPPFGLACGTVPDVVGESQSDAEDAIEDEGLVVGTVTTAYDVVVPAGDVISQDPVGGTVLTPGDPVDLVVSLGPPVNVEVPDVVGELLADAIEAIEDVGLLVGTVTTVPNPAPAGTVLSQDPAGGEEVPPGSEVGLTISSGADPATVPNVIGLSPGTAETVLAAAGLVLGTQTPVASSTVPAGSIVGQSPGAGTIADEGSAVNVTVSSGPPPIVVPDVIGDDYETAFGEIVEAGLRIGTVEVTTEPGAPLNTVRTQYPPAGTEVPADTRVNLVITSLVLPFDVLQTVISQYAQSPTIRRLVDNVASYVDPRANLTNFYNFVWNVDTAVGFGLDIWGRIVNVSRLLRIPSEYDPIFGFDNDNFPYDWQPWGQGRFASNDDGTGGEAYELNDEAYRVLILTKAMANISATDAVSLNNLLQNLFPDRGNAFVRDLGGMEMAYVFEFELTSVERAIVSQADVLPHPAGVRYSVIIDPVS